MWLSGGRRAGSMRSKKTSNMVRLNEPSQVTGAVLPSCVGVLVHVEGVDVVHGQAALVDHGHGLGELGHGADRQDEYAAAALLAGGLDARDDVVGEGAVEGVDVVLHADVEVGVGVLRDVRTRDGAHACELGGITKLDEPGQVVRRTRSWCPSLRRVIVRSADHPTVTEAAACKR